MQQLLSIQYLRALAAISVAIFHEAEGSGKWFSCGAAGVDLFFVISGFIMFVVTETGESSPKMFFWRRFARIVPLYWCATLLTMLICFIHPNLLWGVDTSFIHVITSFLFIPHTNNIGQNWPTLLQGWTLNIEMFFYLVITIALFFPRRLQLQLISIFLAGLVIAKVWLHPQSVITQTFTSSLLLEFVAGLWLGRLWVLGKLPARTIGIILLGLGLLVLSINPLFGDHSKGIIRLIYWGIPAVLIVLGALSVEMNGGILHLPFLKTLGDASYSIYLLHDIVEAVINRLLPFPLLLKAPLSIVAVIVAGVLAFKWFERPMNTLIRKIQVS